MKLNTYLNYGGNCAQAFRFYEQHLGGKITMMMTHAKQPDSTNVPDEWKNAVLHACIIIGGTELIAADIPPERFQPMRSAYLSLSVTRSEEGERIHARSRTAAKSSCRCRKRFLLFVSACCGTSSAPPG